MATLVYSEAGGNSARYQLHGKSIFIGASAECAIRSADPLLAPKHARLFQQNGEYWIEDLGGAAGVFIGDKRVSQSRVPFGEVIVVGSLMLRLDDAASTNGVAPQSADLVRLLAAAGERQKQLEEERNALGARLGELHEELAAAKAALEESSDGAADAPVETTMPLGGFDPASLEKLAGELQAAEKARRDLEAKINSAQRKRARTQSEMTAAEIDAMDDDVAEMEIKQVQLLALQAQMAEADKSVERLRGQLQTRNREIADLRRKTREQTGGDDAAAAPKTTKPYAVPHIAEPDSAADKKFAELKARFEAQFTRAVTLQRKLKTTETRLAEAEKLAANAGQLASETSAAKVRIAELESSNAALSQQLEEAKATPAPAEESEDVAKLKNKLDDLKKLLEGAQRESSNLRGKLTSAKEEAKKAADRAQALEGELGDSAAKAIEQAEKLISLGAELEEKTAEAAARMAEVAAKEAELTDMAAAVAISAEKDQDREKLTAQISSLEGDLANVRAALKRSEESKDAALAARRELEARAIGAKSEADEKGAKLVHAERRVGEAQAARQAAEEALAAAQKDLIAAREARLSAEEALAAENAVPDGDNTAVISLKRRISENQEEAAAEIERLTGRLREVETDLDRALDAEQAALARADAETSAVAAKIDRLTDERDKLATEREAIATERDRQKSELRVLADTLAKKEKEASKLEAELAEARGVTDRSAPAPAPQTSELRSRVVELASQNAQLSSQLSALSKSDEASTGRIRELEAALEDARNETTTVRNRFEKADGELTRRYEQAAEKLSAAETAESKKQSKQMQELLRECQALRERVAELEEGITSDFDVTQTNERIDTASDLEEFTSPGGPGAALLEQMNNLHEAIADLRRQMRAASDEAAVMNGDAESLDVVNTALSAAVERVESAREAMAKLADLVGIP